MLGANASLARSCDTEDEMMTWSWSRSFKSCGKVAWWLLHLAKRFPGDFYCLVRDLLHPGLLADPDNHRLVRETNWCLSASEIDCPFKQYWCSQSFFPCTKYSVVSISKIESVEPVRGKIGITTDDQEQGVSSVLVWAPSLIKPVSIPKCLWAQPRAKVYQLLIQPDER